MSLYDLQQRTDLILKKCVCVAVWGVTTLLGGFSHPSPEHKQ